VTYLLDTNVVSELRRRRPDPAVVAWYEGVAASELFLSVLTVGEIRRGVERLRLKDPTQAESLDRWLQGLCTTYRERIVPIDEPIAAEWGRINAPDPLPVIDSLLAATAIARGWTLVTRNVADVRRSGVSTLDPFTAPAR
jgi:predicted nucleic acid-binding protein